MIHKLWFITVIFYLCFSVVEAQTAMLNSQLFQDRVKLMSQFMHRFNGEEYHPSINANDTDSKRKNLCQLFNIQNVTKKSLESSAFGLIDSIITHNVKFNYEDPRWYAKATCAGTFNKTSVKFEIILIKEKNKNGYYKWAISNVIGNLFSLAPSRKTEKIYLLPNEHDMSFMKLHQITIEKDDYITYYGSDQHQIDPVSVFFTMVYTGQLNIDYVSQLEFICHQVPGYSFTIQEFEEESSNAGWLIDHWTKANDDQKRAQLNVAYNNHYDDVWREYEKTIDKRAPEAQKVKMSDEEACSLVDRFGKALNDYVCTPDSTHFERLSDFMKGIDSSQWLKLKISKKDIKLEDNVKFKAFLASLTMNDITINHIDFNDIRVFNNTDFKDYLKRFVPVFSRIHIEGDVTIDNEIIIFIDEEKITGIKLLDNCF